MRNLLRSFVTIAWTFGVAAACSSDSSGPYNGGNQNQNAMSGTIAGSSWTGTTVLAARSGTTVSIFGRDAQNREVTITITGATSSGTFNIGSDAAAAVEYTVGGQAWVGHLAGATGSVVVSTLTSTYMIGSYNVTLQPQTATGATGTLLLVGTFTGYFGQT